MGTITRSRIGASGAVALFVTMCSGSLAHAGLIETGTYRLGNHPDGVERNPLYGLRLDELFDITPEHDVFTFDFEADGAGMFLDYDGESIHIYGTAFGGLDIGNEHDPDNSSMVEIDFTYGMSEGVPGDDDIWVTTPDFTNTGFIRWLETGEEIDLADFGQSTKGYTFRFGDESGGHRGHAGISGWGWLVHHDSDEYIQSTDWLFTAQLVPAPSALSILALGALGARGRRRRLT